MPAMIQELVAANDGAMTAIIWELIEKITDESYRGGWGLPPWLAALRSNSSTTNLHRNHALKLVWAEKEARRPPGRWGGTRTPAIRQRA